MELLDLLRRRAPIEVSLVAVTVDSGYDAYRHDPIASAYEARGWEYQIEDTDIGSVVDDSWTRTPRRARCARGGGGACCTG